MAMVSGTSVLSLQKYLESAYGDGAFARALDALPAEAAEPLRGVLLPVSWYPTETYVRTIELAHEVFGDPLLSDRLGAFAADFQIKTFQRILLRFASPVFFLDRAGRIWHRFHDSGEWDVVGGNKHVRGTLRGFAVVSAVYCRVLVAWIHRASQLTGTVGETVHPWCRARGDEACVFAGTWK